MKVALVAPALADGGGVPAVARFIKSAALGVRVDLGVASLSMSSRDQCSINLHTPRSWTRGVLTREGTWDGRPFTHVGCYVGELEFQRYRPRAALTRLLADCDIIQVVCGSPAWANAVCGLGKPVSLQVATRARVERRERDSDACGPVGWWRRGMTAITDRLDDRALRRVDAIQVENTWMLDYARAINRDRDVDIRYAPPGIDADVFRPDPSRDPLSDPYILCVGRLDDPRKKVDLLLEAYARVPGGEDAASARGRRTPARLIFAGSAPPSEPFWARASALGLRDHITFVERPDTAALVALYQHASVFVLPSDEEGFGVVVIEAMACGIPVVATRCGGPDGIIANGVDGFLVPRGDADAMAQRLARLLQDGDMNRAMGAKARATVEARFDERVAGAAFIDVWERLQHRNGKV